VNYAEWPSLSRRSLVLLAFMSCLLFVCPSSQPLTAAEPRADAEGWFSLFDGKTLQGWHRNKEKIGHGTGGNWTVEAGGVLAGEQDPPGSGNGGILLTDRKFGDFELSLEMKPHWGSDSGIFLRSNDQGQCIQVLVDYYNDGNIGQFYGEGTGGWNARAFSIRGDVENGKLVGLKTIGARPPTKVGLVASCTPDEWLTAWKIGDWNKMLIRVEGGRQPVITTTINGVKAGVFDAAKATAENYDREKVSELLGDRGYIALQVHGGGSYPSGARCRWRNIRMREL
jgi:Domain of Unknown Function (DUF1080)